MWRKEALWSGKKKKNPFLWTLFIRNWKTFLDGILFFFK